MLRLFLALSILLPTLACAEGTPTTPTPAAQVEASFATVDVHALQSLRSAGELAILDVRTPAEFAAGHIPGALNIDVGVLAQSLDRLEAYRDQPLYVSCRTSNRSRVASALLVDAGFSKVTQVLGGFSEWQASGYEVAR